MRDKKTIKKIKSVGFCSIHLMPALGPGFALLASGVLIGLHKLKMCCLSSCLLVQVALIAGATQSPSGVLTDGPTTGLGCVPGPVVSFLDLTLNQINHEEQLF